jgi:hypothetical protein
MRAIGISRFLEWRWAPCVALSAGACTFVLAAVLAIPDHIGFTRAAERARSGASRALMNNSEVNTAARVGGGYTDADDREPAELASQPGMTPSPARALSQGLPAKRRGFTPPLERPDPPPPPPPAIPEAVPPPAAAAPPAGDPAPVPPPQTVDVPQGAEPTTEGASDTAPPAPAPNAPFGPVRPEDD